MSSAAEIKPGESQCKEMSYLDALVEAQCEELERDERVIMMGEDIAIYGGGKIVKTFGNDRIWSMPISENSFAGVGIGASITGLRPIVDLTIASFMYLPSDQIINQASKLRYMTGGQVQTPVVFRTCMYYNAGLAAQHSDRPYSLFMNVPGLKIVAPTTPADVKGLLKSAVRDDDPVIIFEDTKLWPVKGPVPCDKEHLTPIGKAAVRRAGQDVTIVAIAGATRVAMEAAEVLSDMDVSAEVIDPRTLAPLDKETIIKSVSKTGRLVLVDNAHRTCNASSEIAAIVSEEAFESLAKPIQRVCAEDVHVPFSPALEPLVFPTVERVVNAVKRIL